MFSLNYKQHSKTRKMVEPVTSKSFRSSHSQTLRSSRLDVFCEKGNFIKKETLAQVFSCEFCEISKNTFLYRTPLVAASGRFEK